MTDKSLKLKTDSQHELCTVGTIDDACMNRPVRVPQSARASRAFHHLRQVRVALRMQVRYAVEALTPQLVKIIL